MQDGERKTHVPSTSAALRTARIRLLNDALRKLDQGGRLCLTAGIAALGNATIVAIIDATIVAIIDAIIDAIRRFDDFNADNDPYGEHDFGSVDVADHHVFWKVDTYDRAIEYGSPDPADPAVTTRVLTIMLAEEY